MQKNPAKTITEILDHIELIREELLVVQKSLEIIETAKPALSPNGSKSVKTPA
jgi:hypothetical protein